VGARPDETSSAVRAIHLYRSNVFGVTDAVQTSPGTDFVLQDNFIHELRYAHDRGQSGGNTHNDLEPGPARRGRLFHGHTYYDVQHQERLREHDEEHILARTLIRRSAVGRGRGALPTGAALVDAHPAAVRRTYRESVSYPRRLRRLPAWVGPQGRRALPLAAGTVAGAVLGTLVLVGPDLVATVSGNGGPCASDDLPDRLKTWPDAVTTGVPAGTSLRTVAGDYHTKEDGEIVDRLDITGRLYVDHDDVKVKCTRVRRLTTNNGTGLQMWLSTLGDPRGAREGSALKWSHYTLRRVNIMGTTDGLKAEGDVDVRDSYIHDMFRTADSSQPSGITHNDGVQIGRGSNMVFKHNTFHAWSFTEGQSAGANLLESPFGDGAGYMTSAFLVAADRGPVGNVLIQGNLIRGRTSKPVIVVERDGYEVTRLRILDNVMGSENRDFPQLFAVDEDAVVRRNVLLAGAAVER
jgi:hypothetical protein